MIRFEGIFKSFGPKKVLTGLNLEVRQGEVLFILGRSGTGKSVLLKSLVGLLRPDQGRIELDGEEIQNFSEQQFLGIRRKCGLVFQLPALLDSRTLFENLCFGIRDRPTNEKADRATAALRQVGLENLAADMHRTFPPEISYGEQKRMAVARTLLVDPQYLLYDEPTTGLDPLSSKLIHKLIRDVSKNLHKTSVVVSHDMDNALKTADRIVVLDAGKAIDQGTPDEIRRSEVPLTREFLRDTRSVG